MCSIMEIILFFSLDLSYLKIVCVDLALSNVFSVFSACFLNRECS